MADSRGVSRWQPPVGAPPTTPTWIDVDLQAVRQTADQLGESALKLRTTGRQVQGLLVDAARTLGWRSDAATTAEARAQRTSSRLDTAAGHFDDAGAALGRWADQVSWRRTEIQALLRRRGDVVAAAATSGQASRSPLESSPDVVGAVASVDHELQCHIEALANLDRQVCEVVQRAAEGLRALATASAGDEWVTSLAAAPVFGVLSHHGVLPTQAERELLAAVTFLPTGPDGARALRSLLATWPPDRLADLLLRHPELAERLVGPLPDWLALPEGSPELGLSEIQIAAQGTAPEERIAAVRAYFASLPADQARRLALLYPSVVGNLDGAPLDVRMAANRVGIAAALAAERRQVVELERSVEEQSSPAGWWAGINDRLAIVAELGDPPDRLAAANARIALYEQLLYERVPNPVAGRGRPGVVGHQVLLFDPSGDGRIAELWGTIDEHTQHVGVFVPGTGASLANSAQYADIANRLVQDDRTRTTAAVSWIGADLPDAVVANAASPSYAATGGPALRDFVWGLDVPDTADTTALGHSYGGAVVGVADREGLDVDRVLHIESAGAGRDVFDVEGYHHPFRHIDRYTMTAPGDPIALARAPGETLQEQSGLGHGGDPDTMAGFTRLETGRYHDDGVTPGPMIEGLAAHSDVLKPGSTAWNNMLGVITGGTVIPYTPPTVTTTVAAGRNPYAGPQVRVDKTTHYPYEDPDFPGADPVDIP